MKTSTGKCNVQVIHIPDGFGGLRCGHWCISHHERQAPAIYAALCLPSIPQLHLASLTTRCIQYALATCTHVHCRARYCMKDVTDMDAAVVAICCQLLGTGSCNMYFPAIPDFICCSPSPLARCARPRQAARQMINKQHVMHTARCAMAWSLQISYSQSKKEPWW